MSAMASMAAAGRCHSTPSSSSSSSSSSWAFDTERLRSRDHVPLHYYGPRPRLPVARRGSVCRTLCAANMREEPQFRTTTRDGTFKRPPLPLLSADQIIYRRRNSIAEKARDTYRSFFSSDVGGITQDPALMMLSIDDHMVHRGHGVFDTCLLANGQLYMLDAHVERLLRSAKQAGIRDFYKTSTIKNIIHDVAAASGLIDGMLRYWLTAGRGVFGLSSEECIRPGFHCVCTSLERPKPRNAREALTGLIGWQVMTPKTECKSAFMAGIKSNNYLLNALAADEAVRDIHATGQAVWVDEEGFVAEGGNFNVAFITNDNEVVVPTFDNSLAGCTAQRMMELIPQTPELKHLRVSQRKITETEAKMECREMLALGSTAFATPIFSWDQKVYNYGDSQFDSYGIRNMLINDAWSKEPHELHTEVDYALLTHGQGP